MKLKKIIIVFLFLMAYSGLSFSANTTDQFYSSSATALSQCKLVNGNCGAVNTGILCGSNNFTGWYFQPTAFGPNAPQFPYCPNETAAQFSAKHYQLDPATNLYTKVPLPTCPDGQYANSSTYTCGAIPLCNSSAPLDGKYFDTVTASCVQSTVQSPICIPDNLTLHFFCPPTNDCYPAAKACSNDPTAVIAADSQKVTILANIKTAADDKAAQAATAAASATAASNNKASLSTAANSNQLSLKAISDSVASSASSTTASIAKALGAYSAALTASVSAASSAANSATSAAAAVAGSADIAAKAALIPSSNTGNATALYSQIGDQLAGTLAALNDAIAGLGAGSGAGTGTGAGTGETGLAKDATLQALSNKLNPDTAPFSALPAGTRTIDESVNALLGKIKSKLPTVVYSDVSPACPVFSALIPYLNFTMKIDQFCTMDPTIRPILQTMSVFTYSLMAFFIIMGA